MRYDRERERERERERALSLHLPPRNTYLLLSLTIMTHARSASKQAGMPSKHPVCCCLRQIMHEEEILIRS
jgi:hypothetical protein